jgi:hypothetical protein
MRGAKSDGRDAWLPILQNNRELELARYFRPYHDWYNVTCHQTYWRTRDVDTLLRMHGYCPEHRTSAGWSRSAPTPPARSSSKSGSSDGRTTALRPYHTQPCRSGGVFIRQAHGGSSSVPPRVKKEAEVKEEMPAPEEDKHPWWVKELVMASTAHHPENSEDEPGLHMLHVRSLNESQPMDETSALV